MILNLLELRKNNWKPRKSADTGPKKIDQIHKEIKQEQIQNQQAREQVIFKRYTKMQIHSQQPILGLKFILS